MAMEKRGVKRNKGKPEAIPGAVNGGIDVPAFNYGELVYHKTGESPGIISGVLYRESGMAYEVTWRGRVTEYHTACELTREKPVMEKNYRGEDE